jgi:hypothetical protein
MLKIELALLFGLVEVLLTGYVGGSPRNVVEDVRERVFANVIMILFFVWQPPSNKNNYSFLRPSSTLSRSEMMRGQEKVENRTCASDLVR